MIKHFKFTLILFLGLAFVACEELESLFGEETNQLTEAEVVEGLKTALKVGTDTAVTVTSQTGGYYQDEIIKILLPEEVKDVANYMNQLGLNDQLETFLLSMNRAAEDAADEAGPIFTNAITSLSIAEGWNILNGINPAGDNNSESFDSTAATSYLRSTTYNELFDAFQPKIKASLDKKLVGNLSTSQLWNDITTTYNASALILGWNTIEVDLDVYVTEEGLDGLFFKVGEEEKAIRRDPAAWAQTAVGDILKKVFANN